jgi:hypothetical protein
LVFTRNVPSGPFSKVKIGPSASYSPQPAVTNLSSRCEVFDE